MFRENKYQNIVGFMHSDNTGGLHDQSLLLGTTEIQKE